MNISRIIIADTQTLTLAGLTKILSESGQAYKIETVKDAGQLFASMDKNSVGQEILFIDYRCLPDFRIEDFNVIVNDYHAVKTIVMSSDDDEETILQVLDSGVPGFLTKECDEVEIITSMAAIGKGEKFFCHKIVNILMRSRSANQRSNPSFLTDRELEVIKLIAQGNSTYEIASILHLSHHTISSHRKNIIRKLNIKSPTEFVVHAIDLGLINV